MAYAAGLLMFVLGDGGPVGGGGVTVASFRRRGAPARSPPPPPGSVYRSHIVFERLWPDIRDDAAPASTATAASANSLSTPSSWRRSMVRHLTYRSYLSYFKLDGDLGSLPCVACFSRSDSPGFITTLHETSGGEFRGSLFGAFAAI
jgi:hypothetical protein